MKIRVTGALALLLLCLGLQSCGGGGGGGGQFAFTGDPERFTLNVLEESALGEALEGDFSLRRHDEGEQVVLELEARDALDLRAVYYEVEFNPNLYTPISAERSTLLGSAGVIELAILDQPGLLTHGQLLIHPMQHPGFSGDGVLATLRFERRPMEPGRGVSEPPSDSGSQSTPQFNNLNGELSWFYRNTGDYDQNGIVTISDLTPMGVNFGDSQTGGFDDSTAQSVVDGDGNGQINISDITPIGIGFGRSSSGGFNIYRSGNASDYPADPLGGNGTGASLLGNLPFSAAVGNPTVDRMAFSFTVSDPGVPGFYWVRPLDGAGNEGFASSFVSPPDGSLPVLSIPLPPTTGGGSLADPFIVTNGQTVQFRLDDKDGVDVTTDALSSFAITPDTAGSFGSQNGLLTVAVDHTGPFSVSAEYDGLSAAQLYYFNVGQLDGPPIAVLKANRQYGPVPLGVSFDASESIAPGGDAFLVEYAFDWTDDGVYDEIAAASKDSFVFNETGLFTVRLKVTDSKDRSTETTLQVLVYEAGGPTASLVASPTKGREPLDVDFDAGASKPKADTTITGFEFDFNNDFDFSDASSATGEISRTFFEPGVIPVRVKVSDSQGLYSVAERVITVNANIPPVAAMTISPVADPSWFVPVTLNFDASSSSDEDGDIIGYSFDFDGDGVYDYEGAESLQSFEYTEAGVYNVELKVTDDVLVTNMLVVPVEIFFDSRPIAMLTADVTSGLDPLTVNFDATASVDPEGMITSYEWDFNGDGDFSDLVETTGVVQFDYISPATYHPAVRVNDAEGKSAVATVTITVTANAAPNADVRADKLNGFTPVTINFDGSNSSDSDGTIELYEWDVDGDEDYDDGYGNVDSISILYDDMGGSFTIRLRVTDDKFKSSTDSVTVSITNNEPPVADLQASLLSGFRPLKVDFDATASMDPDGTIASYRWDFDYDGATPDFVLEGAEDQPSFTFDTARIDPYLVLLEVIDNGGKSSQATVSIAVMDNADPVASLSADSSSFDISAPVAIEFNASLSDDLDGDMITADWDFDGDGTYEPGYIGTDPDVPQSYLSWTLPGSYLATVRITDEHGATDYATWPVVVSGGQPAPTVSLSSPCTSGEAPFAVYFDADGSDSNGVIEKYEFDFDGELNGWNWQESGKLDKGSFLYTQTGNYTAWVRATDDDGAVALASLPIVAGDDFDFMVLDAGVASAEWMDAAIVDGRPAVAYASGSSQLRFVIANDAAGSSWQDPQILVSENCSRVRLIELENGRAGIAYYNNIDGMKFLRALDSDNDGWTTPVVIEASVDSKDIDIVRLQDDHPAAAYFVGSNLKFKYCEDVNGDLPTSWPAAAVTVDTTASQPMRMELVFLRPAIAYRNEYARSSDQFGTNWPDNFATGLNGGNDYTLMDIGNQPHILSDQGSFHLISSADEGATWPNDYEIDPVNGPGRYNSGTYLDTLFQVVGSRAISASNFSVPITRQLYFHESTDAAGSLWTVPYGLETLQEQGIRSVMLDVGGQPAVFYRGTHNGNNRVLKMQIRR
ncbi:MAG: PKD domain-containing protein [bacterium]